MLLGHYLASQLVDSGELPPVEYIDAIYDEMVGYSKFAYETRKGECKFVFQRAGKRVKSIRTAFVNARSRLGLEKLLFHDLRRTGVRNMERANVPRTVARQVSGHRTESVSIRYAIGAEKDALEVGERMAAFHKEQRRKTADREKLWGKLWGSESELGKEEGPALGTKFKQ